MSPDFAQAGDDRRQQRVLGGVDLGRERLEGVARLDPHFRLREDRAAVDLERHAVHRAAGHLHAAAQRLADAVQPGKLRQQARMQVDDLPREGAEEPGFRTRMNPARTTRPGSARRTAAMKRRSPSPSSFVLNGAGSTKRAGTPKRGPSARMPASGRSEKSRRDPGLAEIAGLLRRGARLGIRAAAGAKEDDAHAVPSSAGRLQFARSSSWC